MSKEENEIEIEYMTTIMQTGMHKFDANLLIAMFKEYGESKYKEGVKDTTDKFATKTDDGFGNSILYGTGSSH
tara:strand:- start:328 stop:546 length:219 start_codon:yes stop_codon:yes gene_type:complete